MTSNVTTIANGLRVVTQEMPHLETVSLGAWVGVGARHDPEPQNGIAHFLEHMAFKGTAKRTARDIAEEIEDLGGDLNAATSLETTAYFARVLKGDEAMAMDILSDILRNSHFDGDEVMRERDVILQEIAASRDCPDDVVYDLAQAVAYPEQPLGRTILGTPQTVEAITRCSLRAYLDQRYVPERMVLSAAGAVDHVRLLRLAEDLFGGFSCAEAQQSVDQAVYRGGVTFSAQPFEQCHVLVGFEAPSHGAPGYFAAQVLSGLLGGGMSSRLFQEAREKRGLCYSVYSSVFGLSDTGMMTIHAATTPEVADELLGVICGEILRLADEGACEKEVLRSKAQLKSGLMMGLESSATRAEQMARQLICRGRLIDKDELMAKVDAVDTEDVRSLLQSMVGGRPTIAVVGAGGQSQEHAERANEMLCPAAMS
jgi:predicted Zn-dependent peptidase